MTTPLSEAHFSSRLYSCEMPDAWDKLETMICFDIYLNGEKLCRAGFEDADVLTTMLSWARRDGEAHEMFLEAGGLRVQESGGNVHLRWLQDLPVGVGDRIRIEIVESDSPDEPEREDVETAEEIKRHKKRYYEAVRHEFEK